MVVRSGINLVLKFTRARKPLTSVDFVVHVLGSMLRLSLLVVIVLSQ